MKAEEIKNKREVKKEKNNMKTKNKDKCREQEGEEKNKREKRRDEIDLFLMCHLQTFSSKVNVSEAQLLSTAH